MATQKHFLQDRNALLLVSVNSFLFVASVALILLRLSSSHGSGTYIIQCRDCSNQNDISRFTNGTIVQILSFIGFALIVYVLGVVMSYRIHPLKRELSYIVLALTVPLLIFSLVVAYSLLLSH